MLALPTRRDEEWKYSDLRAAFAGRAAPALLGEGAVIERIAAGLGQTQALQLPAGEHLLLVDEIAGDGLHGTACSIEVGAAATLERIVFQTGAELPLDFIRVRLQAGATFRQFVYAEGGRLARVETHVEAVGEGAVVALDGVYLAAAGRHADLTSRVTVAAPGVTVRQRVRGAARKGGRGVFQGRILVGRLGQKADARQNHDALVLEDGAEIDAKPELEIYADDVQCAHGNAIGALDANALFYLRSRGLPEAGARALLVAGFLAETVSDWLPGDVREQTEARMRAWLEAAP